MNRDKKKVQSIEEEKKIGSEEQKQVCGIVMPISEIDGLPKSHWDEVYNIIAESIYSAGFKPNLVSNSEDIGVIQKRIVQNLYENPIVVCDVSAKNPNVMFELGLRLAFDKPTIIIKDDKTNYSFDTSPIEHLEYPRDLRFSKIRDFGDKLANKINSTYKKSVDDQEYSTFLKHFGTFKVAKIETEEVTKEDLIIDEVKALRSLVLRGINNKNRNNISLSDAINSNKRVITITLRKSEENFKNEIEESISQIIASEMVENVFLVKESSKVFILEAKTSINFSDRIFRNYLTSIFEDKLISFD